ncbi:signal recognition particle srp9 subunit [Diaporthe eres]|uniref:SRP9 domain-containing protein n=1 Tax=Diaporthe vaccinii TaxID=105482 RepID=A0ABR4EJN1_9PEZI|nr:signal recognition particle srp9 subunit [Diaporthe eres]
MPYILTSQEWLAQSALLIEARPTTARVTTKYNIKPAKARTAKKAKKDGDDDTPMTDADAAAAAAATKPPRASLIIKTFEPHSGVCLKYKTTKAAEVSRLVQLLGSLGRKMASLPDAPAPAVAAVDDEAAAGTATPPVAGPGGAAGAGQAAQQAQAGAGGGGGQGKKKKKGKR